MEFIQIHFICDENFITNKNNQRQLICELTIFDNHINKHNLIEDKIKKDVHKLIDNLNFTFNLYNTSPLCMSKKDFNHTIICYNQHYLELINKIKYKLNKN